MKRAAVAMSTVIAAAALVVPGLASAAGRPCPIPSGGYSATVSPSDQGSGSGPFQVVDNGTGPQAPITVTFGVPLLTVAVTAIDPDFAGTRMEAYATDGTGLSAVYFDSDNRPGWTNASTKSITDSRGIGRIVLIPAENDYVAFQDLTAWPL